MQKKSKTYIENVTARKSWVVEPRKQKPPRRPNVHARVPEAEWLKRNPRPALWFWEDVDYPGLERRVRPINDNVKPAKWECWERASKEEMEVFEELSGRAAMTAGRWTPELRVKPFDPEVDLRERRAALAWCAATASSSELVEGGGIKRPQNSIGHRVDEPLSVLEDAS